MTAGPVTTQQGLGRGGGGGDPVASGHSQHLSPLRCHKILQQNYLQFQLFIRNKHAPRHLLGQLVATSTRQRETRETNTLLPEPEPRPQTRGSQLLAPSTPLPGP